MKSMLELRKKMKSKKPLFISQEAHKRKKLKKRWRRPRGIHSKLRLKFRGKRKIPSVGFSAPKPVRGLDKSGLEPIVVKQIDVLKNIDKKSQGVVIGKVGKKNKIALLEECMKLNLTVLNVNNIKKKIEDLKKQKQKISKLKSDKKLARKKKAEKLKKDKKKDKEKKSKEEVKEPVKKEEVKEPVKKEEVKEPAKKEETKKPVKKKVVKKKVSKKEDKQTKENK